jgi:hypothetical protein
MIATNSLAFGAARLCEVFSTARVKPLLRNLSIPVLSRNRCLAPLVSLPFESSYLAPKALLQLQPGASPQGFDYAITSAESALQSARRIKRVSENESRLQRCWIFHFTNPGALPQARE